MPSPLIEKYLRLNRLPHIWCPGCGIGEIVNGLIQVYEALGGGWQIRETGCDSRPATSPAPLPATSGRGAEAPATPAAAPGPAAPGTGASIARPERGGASGQ